MKKKNNIRIGFDGKRAAQNRTGLGNYSRFIVSALARFAPQLRLHVYTPNPHKTDALNGLSKLPSVRMYYPKTPFWKRFGSLWRVWHLTSDLKEDRVQLFHGLSNELPLSIRRARDIKSVVTIHDLIFLRYPQYYGLVSRWIYRYKFRNACRLADRIIAVSECTKRDIMHFFGTPGEKIEVIYQGCDPQFRQPVPEGQKDIVRRHYHLPTRYILYVGSIEQRKNLKLLAEALPLLQDKHVKVIAVGKPTSYTKHVRAYLKKHGLNNRFFFLHRVPFGDLPALYQMSEAFVYPSRFEGFGIPMLEALCSGIPAIGCTGSCLEEAGGPSSLYVNPDDPQALADALDRVLADETLRARMIADGYAFAAHFEEEKLTAQLRDLYMRLLGK